MTIFLSILAAIYVICTILKIYFENKASRCTCGGHFYKTGFSITGFESGYVYYKCDRCGKEFKQFVVD